MTLRFLIFLLVIAAKVHCSELPDLNSSPSEYKDHVLFNPHELHNEKVPPPGAKPLSLAALLSLEIPERKYRVLKADMQACYRITERASLTFGVYNHKYGMYIDPNQGMFGGWVIDY